MFGISSFLQRLPGLVTQHPLASFIVALTVLIPFSIQLPHLKSLDNVDDISREGHPDTAFYELMKETFGDDEFFVIAFSSPELFSTEMLGMIDEITERLEQIPEVREVQSLANVDFIEGSQDYFEVRKFLQRIPEDAEGLTLLKEQALENDLYKGNIINSEGDTTAIIVFPHSHDPKSDGSFRKRLIEKTQKVLEVHRDRVEGFHLAGWTVTNLTLSQYMQSDVAVFIPATYLFVTLTVWLVFRNIRMTFLALVNISACTATTMGAFPVMGITLNTVTTIVPPLVMALALSDAVHIFAQLDRRILEQSQSPANALRTVLKGLIVPCFLTSLTTAVGFISLVVSEIGPIRDFALVSSAGMLFKLFFSFTLLPALILFCDADKMFRPQAQTRLAQAGVQCIARLNRRYSRHIAISALLLSIVSLWAAQSIEVETNLLGNFKKSSTIRQDLDFVASRLSGVATLDISLRAPDKDAFLDPARLEVIESLQRFAEDIPGVDRSISFVDFLKDMNMSFHNEDRNHFRLPDSREMVSQYLLLYDAADLDEFITADYDHARILLRLSEHGSAGQARIIHALQDFPGLKDPAGLTIRISGRAVQDVNTIEALVWGQIESLALAAAVITVILFLALRSWSTGALSLLPNAFPIILNFGIMGLLGIPLNTATALISVVAIGIAVDDTIHFLTEYTRYRADKLSVPEALQRTTLEKGLAISATSLILIIGFGVLLCSSFVPTISFGGLSAVIMFTAWVGDMIVLPAVMLAFHDRRQ